MYLAVFRRVEPALPFRRQSLADLVTVVTRGTCNVVNRNSRISWIALAAFALTAGVQAFAALGYVGRRPSRAAMSGRSRS
jgi:hypothetical protein